MRSVQTSLGAEGVAAAFLGGTEKIKAGTDYGVPLVKGADPVSAVELALSGYEVDAVVDLSDEPVIGYRERMKIASLALFAEYRDREPTNRAGPDPVDMCGGDADEVVDGGLVAKNNPIPQPNHHWGDGASKDLMTFVNFDFPLDSMGGPALYAFGGYMVFYSIGSAAGGIGATMAYAMMGWSGVCMLGSGISAAALLVWVINASRMQEAVGCALTSSPPR